VGARGQAQEANRKARGLVRQEILKRHTTDRACLVAQRQPRSSKGRPKYRLIAARALANEQDEVAQVEPVCLHFRRGGSRQPGRLNLSVEKSQMAQLAPLIAGFAFETGRTALGSIAWARMC
jgi:hypothetical protein